MKDRKYRVEPFAFYDYNGIQHHLESMAQKGWMLDGMVGVFWRYRRIEPRSIPFAVTYDLALTEFDPLPGPDDPLVELCAHSGWTLTASCAQMQVFYNLRPDPVPLETDPVVAVENIHRMVEKTLYPNCGLFLALGLLCLVLQLNNLFSAPFDLLSSDMNLLLLVFGVLTLPYSIGSFALYHHWHKQAAAAAEQGEFFAAKSHPRVRLLLWLLYPILLFGYFALGESAPNRSRVLLGMVIVVACLLVQARLRRKRTPAERNREISILVMIVLTVAFTVFRSNGIIDQLDRSHILHGWQVDPPLVLADLDVKAIEDSRFTTGDESFLMGTFAYWEAPVQGDETEFQYSLTVVKQPFLYAFCRDTRLEPYTLDAVPAAPWGAREAYRIEDSDRYFLCYETVIVGITFPWSPTPEQMALVGETLGALDL